MLNKGTCVGWEAEEGCSMLNSNLRFESFPCCYSQSCNLSQLDLWIFNSFTGKKEDNKNTYLIGLFCRLNAITHRKRMTHNKCLGNVNDYCFHVPRWHLTSLLHDSQHAAVTTTPLCQKSKV
jgi:hypothetical protein